MFQLLEPFCAYFFSYFDISHTCPVRCSQATTHCSQMETAVLMFSLTDTNGSSKMLRPLSFLCTYLPKAPPCAQTNPKRKEQNPAQTIIQQSLNTGKVQMHTLWLSYLKATQCFLCQSQHYCWLLNVHQAFHFQAESTDIRDDTSAFLNISDFSLEGLRVAKNLKASGGALSRWAAACALSSWETTQTAAK